MIHTAVIEGGIADAEFSADVDSPCMYIVTGSHIQFQNLKNWESDSQKA
jgi:hypothetical protein